MTLIKTATSDKERAANIGLALGTGGLGAGGLAGAGYLGYQGIHKDN